MNVFIHDINGTQVAEVQSEGIMIRSARDAADIARELLARGISRLILRERNLSPEFWQLPNGLAEGILEEFTRKSVVVAFAGKLDRNRSESIAALILERHLNNQAFVADSVESAKMRFTAK